MDIRIVVDWVNWQLVIAKRRSTHNHAPIHTHTHMLKYLPIEHTCTHAKCGQASLAHSTAMTDQFHCCFLYFFLVDLLLLSL